ncbi:Activator of stress genes 1 [Talaromyces islandicus]|uniref:Activator of stress genes 1 n=1 Tax=Talaromyces islandicus TaxID=28573 RepID=A0A0U1MAS7_TALIS|nr:Activator of stress genes 1 [Talaromyces islandicus]
MASQRAVSRVDETKSVVTTNFRPGSSRFAETSPGDAELQRYQIPETSFPLRMGYLGPTSVVAELLSSNELASDMGDETSTKEENSTQLPSYWFNRVLTVLALLEDFPIFEVLADEFYEVSQAAMIPSPFVRNAFEPIRKLSQEYLLKRRSDIQLQRLASNIVENTAKSFHIPSSTEGCDFHKLYTGDNTRLEILGIIFSIAGRSTHFGLGSGLFVSNDEPRSRAQFAQKMFLASDITLQVCKMLTPINDLLVWLLYENMLLSSMIHGDSSEAKWSRLGDLSTNIFTLGAHREVKPSSGLPKFIVETRKRLFASSYRLDKHIATSLDRPPRLSFRHSDCGLPLALADDVYGASNEVFDQACKNLDPDGWSIKSVYQTSDWIRARYMNNTFREEILEMAVRTPSPEAAAQLNDISRRCKDKWESYPAHLRFVPYVWNDEAPVAVSLMLVTAYLAYLDNDLIIQKLLVGKYHASNFHLLSVSSQILSTVLFLGTQREHMRYIHRDLAWVIVLYGFPAVSVLIRALQSEARNGTPFEYSGSRAELIRNLSVFISHIESMERPGNGNYLLFSRASKMFSSMIDEILEARLRVDVDDAMSKPNMEMPVVSAWNENENLKNFIGNENFLESVDFRMMFDQWLV